MKYNNNSNCFKFDTIIFFKKEVQSIITLFILLVLIPPFCSALLYEKDKYNYKSKKDGIINPFSSLISIVNSFKSSISKYFSLIYRSEERRVGKECVS